MVNSPRGVLVRKQSVHEFPRLIEANTPEQLGKARVIPERVQQRVVAQVDEA